MALKQPSAAPNLYFIIYATQDGFLCESQNNLKAMNKNSKSFLWGI